MEKEPELVCEDERFKLDIVGLTSASGEWNLLSCPTVGESRQLVFPTCTLRFSPMDERVASLQLWVRERTVTIVCVCALNDSSQYSDTWWCGTLLFSAYIGSKGVTKLAEVGWASLCKLLVFLYILNFKTQLLWNSPSKKEALLFKCTVFYLWKKMISI